MPKKLMRDIVRCAESQGAVATRSSGGGWRISTPGIVIIIHSSSSDNAVALKAIRRDFRRAGLNWNIS